MLNRDIGLVSVIDEFGEVAKATPPLPI